MKHVISVKQAVKNLTLKSQMKRINTDFQIVLDLGCIFPSVSCIGFDSNLLL